jgi:hypothetical protein
MGKITWGDMKSLSDALDGIASDMNIQGYSSLADDDSTPFSQSGMVGASCTYKFSVTQSAGAPKTLANWAENLSVPSPLDTLASNGDLYFVNDPDGCWCKTIFKVVPDGNNYQFVRVDDVSIGCCQTLDVPSDGSLLDSTQNFIPAGIAAGFNRGVYDLANQGQVYRDGMRCVNDGGNGTHFTFSQGSDPTHYDLIEAGRDMSGNLTWPIRSKWFDSIWSQIQDIITGSCGAFDQCVYADGDSDYLNEGCAVTIADLVYTLNKEGTLGSNPGCFADATTLPWYSTTCGGSSCGDTGSPLVYQETMDQLWSIINSLESKLQPYEDGCCANESGYTLGRQDICGADCDPETSDPACAGLPSSFDLTPYQGEGLLGKSDCQRYWRIADAGYGNYTGRYPHGTVDDEGTLTDLPNSFEDPGYCYVGHMALQIGVAKCSDNDPDGIDWPAPD